MTAGIIEMHGKILIARRKIGGSLENRWEFPGGTVEPCETPEQCLVRELQEEFGILTVVRDYVGSSIFAYEEITIELLAYSVSYISGQFQLHSHEEIRWVSLDELDLFDFAEADVPFIKQLKETAKVGTSENDE